MLRLPFQSLGPNKLGRIRDHHELPAAHLYQHSMLHMHTTCFEKYKHSNTRMRKEQRKKEDYAGSKMLPASIMEKEAHWPEVLSILYQWKR